MASDKLYTFLKSISFEVIIHSSKRSHYITSQLYKLNTWCYKKNAHWLLILNIKSGCIGFYEINFLPGNNFVGNCLFNLLVSITAVLIILNLQDEVRGTLGVFNQVFMSFGFLLMYCIGPYASAGVLLMCCAYAVLLFGIIFAFMPDSPHHLVTASRKEDAISALCWLRGDVPPHAIQREMQAIEVYKTPLKTSSKYDYLNFDQSINSLVLTKMWGENNYKYFKWWFNFCNQNIIFSPKNKLCINGAPCRFRYALKLPRRCSGRTNGNFIYVFKWPSEVEQCLNNKCQLIFMTLKKSALR